MNTIPTPVDSLTGLPYPIISGRDIDNLRGLNVVNKNHAFFPKSDLRLKTISGLALRVCRLQTVEAKYHNYGEHAYHNFYEGPTIPESDNERFRTIIFALAGYIPRQGIDLTGAEPVERDMTEREYDKLRTIDHGDYKYFTYGESAIRVFFRQLVLDNAINTDVELLDKFVNTRNTQHRRQLGHTILQNSADIVAVPVEKDYHDVLSSGLLKPTVPDRSVVYIRKAIRNRRRVEERMFSPLTRVASFAVEAA